jgi:type I restriction enzyme R subunit
LHGPHVAPGELAAERTTFGDAVLPERLKAAIARFNPSIPFQAQDEAYRKVTQRAWPTLILDNRAFHRMLVDGVEVEYRHTDGSIRGAGWARRSP